MVNQKNSDNGVLAFRKLSRIGTGVAVFIPAFFLKELNLSESDMVSIFLDKSSNALIIKKIGGDVNGVESSD